MTPLGSDEFAELLAPMGPFGVARQIVVAVSGGADSMALAWLLRRWGDPLAIVVDHGLRTGSGHEAELTMQRLDAIGIEARLVQLDGLCGGPDLGARARTARHAALLQACREAGRLDLFMGHHRQDLAETVLLRAAHGSGPAGLAGMPLVAWRGDARLLRPLLSIVPARLRATLRLAGVDWVEDPTNTDPATARGGLRLRGVPDAAAGLGYRHGLDRRAMEATLASEMARHVTLHPTGHAIVDGCLTPEAWSALIWTISGRNYPPAPAAVHRLARHANGTLHGVKVCGGLVSREVAALAAPVQAGTGVCWDGRFMLHKGVPFATIGSTGTDSPRLRLRTGLPSAVLQTLPALRVSSDLSAVPHIAYPDGETCLTVQVEYRPPRPLAGAPFSPV